MLIIVGVALFLSVNFSQINDLTYSLSIGLPFSAGSPPSERADLSDERKQLALFLNNRASHKRMNSLAGATRLHTFAELFSE